MVRSHASAYACAAYAASAADACANTVSRMLHYR